MSDLHLNELIYQSRIHLLEMIEERGFNIKKIKQYSKEELILLLENHRKGGFDTSGDLSALDIYVSDENERKLIIKYRLDSKFKKSKNLENQINEIYDKYSMTKNDCLIILNDDIIIFKDNSSSNVLIKFINQELSKGHFIQVYGVKNFTFNISKHIYVPKHKIVSKEKQKEIVELYRTKIEKLPRILREDAMAKFIGAKPGDLIEIKGYSETAGFINKYRLCVDV